MLPAEFSLAPTSCKQPGAQEGQAGGSFCLAAPGRRASWGSSTLALLHSAHPGWANTNIYFCRQGCGSGPFPVLVAPLGPGDGFAGWGVGTQLVWAEREPWEMAGRELDPRPQIAKITVMVTITIIYKVLAICQMLG